MKKFLSILLASLMALMLVPLSACSKKDDSESEPTETPSAETEFVAESKEIISEDELKKINEDEFFGQNINAYTDEVLTADRDKLNLVPLNSNIEFLNRVTDYLSAAEPQGDGEGYHTKWMYGNTFTNTNKGLNKLYSVKIPAFENDDVRYIDTLYDGPQTIENVNDAFVSNGVLSTSLYTVTFFHCNGTYKTAKNRFDTLLKKVSEEAVPEEIYSFYNEGTETGYIADIVHIDAGAGQSVDGTIYVIGTQGAGDGPSDSDVISETQIVVQGNPIMTQSDYASLTGFLASYGLELPADLLTVQQ